MSLSGADVTSLRDMLAVLDNDIIGRWQGLPDQVRHEILDIYWYGPDRFSTLDDVDGAVAPAVHELLDRLWQLRALLSDGILMQEVASAAPHGPGGFHPAPWARRGRGW